MLNDYPDILFVSDICELLNISSNTACSLFRTGSLSGFKIGKAWCTTKSNLINYIQDKCSSSAHTKKQ